MGVVAVHVGIPNTPIPMTSLVRRFRHEQSCRVTGTVPNTHRPWQTEV
jgi:hypothetical protein